tara:strand:- start:176 stop:868 length:693 start_codon:yes stop_codon:yes gene_type:complete
MMQGTNNYVMITASSKGLGKAIAKEFASKGFNLILNGRDQRKLNDTMNEIIADNSKNIKCEYVLGDLRLDNTIEKLYKISRDKLAVLINNAAIPCYGLPLEEMVDDQVYESLETNLIAPIKLTKKIYPLFKEQGYGSIININSIVGKEPKKFRSIHSATKWGLKGFTKSLRIEASYHNVDLINIYPSRIRTNDEFHYGLEPKKVASEIFQSYSSSTLEKTIDGRPEKYKP